MNGPRPFIFLPYHPKGSLCVFSACRKAGRAVPHCGGYTGQILVRLRVAGQPCDGHDGHLGSIFRLPPQLLPQASTPSIANPTTTNLSTHPHFHPIFTPRLFLLGNSCESPLFRVFYPKKWAFRKCSFCQRACLLCAAASRFSLASISLQDPRIIN